MRTLKNNYAVAIQYLGPEAASLSVSQAKEIFIPTLGFGLNKRSTQSASFSWLDAAEQVKSSYSDVDFAISQLIPIGGTFSVSLAGYRNWSNSKFQTVNPRFGGTLRFDFRQPLLRGFGTKMTRYNIIVNQNNLQISENDLDSTLINIIFAVESAYWNLVYSIENLKVAQESLLLARDLLAKNQRAVEVGTMAPIDVLSAQAEVALREADIITTETQVKNNEDRLRTIINLPEEEMKLALPIKPLDIPKYEINAVNLEESLMTAMQNRPELKSLKVQLQNQDLSLSYAKNQLLPALNLTASYWSPGISGSQIIYLNNDPLSGQIIATIPGGASKALSDALGLKYSNWAVGLTLDIPLNSLLSKAAYQQAKLNVEQAMLQLKNQEQTVYLEIRNGVRDVQANYQRVQAYRVARELAEKKLQAEQEKLKVGLSTNFVVLSYQRDLSNARISELKAIVDYAISLANLDKVMGVSLKTKNINVTQLTKN
jgi:outer membrane protein TolC